MGGGEIGGWKVHGVGGYVIVWVVVGWVGGGFMGWVHVLTHPCNSYNVKIFNFMNTHPPTHRTYPKCHSVTIHILWRVHGVGWVVEEFMGGSIYSPSHEFFNHPPHH